MGAARTIDSPSSRGYRALHDNPLDRRAVRLAWGIGLCCLGLAIASLVLLALDWKTIDSPLSAQDLTNMTDRLNALGGEVEVTSAPGRGTQLHGSLPVVAVGVPA